MPEFKLVINDVKSGKSYQKAVTGDESDVFKRTKIGSIISGDTFGFNGFEFEITGLDNFLVYRIDLFAGWPTGPNILAADYKVNGVFTTNSNNFIYSNNYSEIMTWNVMPFENKIIVSVSVVNEAKLNAMRISYVPEPCTILFLGLVTRV